MGINIKSTLSKSHAIRVISKLFSSSVSFYFLRYKEPCRRMFSLFFKQNKGKGCRREMNGSTAIKEHLQTCIQLYVLPFSIDKRYLNGAFKFRTLEINSYSKIYLLVYFLDRRATHTILAS